MIKNNILKTELIEWEELEWLQGNLKDITKESLKRLKQSLKNNNFIMPFNVWEGDKKYILDGHHRLKALKELQKEGNEIPKLLPANFIKCKNKKEASKLVLVYSSIYANVTEQGLTDFMFDFDLTVEDLPEIDLPLFDLGKILDNSRDVYTKKIDAPIYEIKGENPDESDLYDSSKSEYLIEEIEKSRIKDVQKEFLRKAAQRHIVFNYSKIAEYYAHADKEVQSLMERPALIIIDFDRALRDGYVKLSKEIENQYAEDYG